ncbi:VOC family protein [Flavobacterium sp. HSC-61S13]|uniref:VOC family protein n=1 Tax=Flavobacterium sp. HSC-61S13 TaxID=2910963 RepID=UPI0020A204CC|nr:glyoxalase [Flavobacterium sp. HSC-61S13]MCP1996502.1 catechol-2,3-dioxygenase [Flavobacterium sp. HSC-61S13]
MKINAITIETNSLENTQHFYSDILQFNLTYKSDLELHYKIGHSLLKFVETTKPIAVYHYAFNIPASLLDNALIWSTKHLKLIKNPKDEWVTTFENWNAQAIYFLDNNGNLLEFIARHDRKESIIADSFDPSKIEGISEIGIVTAQPMELAENWIEQYGLSYFEKSPPTTDFLAIGDDEGLLIVVSPQRNWFPTAIPARETLTQIEISLADTGSIHLSTTCL